MVHLAGFGFEDTHSVANGITWGPDGWLYGAQGSTVSCRVTRPGIDPASAPGVHFEGCMVWRYHPKSREFEIFAEGGGNVFGLDFDADGRLFSGHNGGGTRGFHYVQGGLYLKQGKSPGKFGPPDNLFAFGELPMMPGGSIPRFSHNVIAVNGVRYAGHMAGQTARRRPSASSLGVERTQRARGVIHHARHRLSGEEFRRRLPAGLHGQRP